MNRLPPVNFMAMLLPRIRLLLIPLLLIALFGPQFAVASPVERPNIVLILADDQSYRDFGFMGNRDVHTPNIDRLARASARYPNGYVPMSVCRPSLATLLTGLYPHQHGIHFNHPPPGLSTMRHMSAAEYEATRASTDYLIETVPTLPRILASHGYACLQTGKHWEGSFRTAGFTHGMTLGRPADRISPIVGTRKQQNGELVAHGNGDAGLTIGRETMQPIFDFIEDKAGRHPFFVWYAPFLPHTPFDAPARFHRLYQGKPIPDHMRPYYAEIARFDETVGQLMNFLEKKALIDNTLIIFVVDNGFRPHREKKERYNDRSKLSVFEDGLRTPLLIRFGDRTIAGDHPQLVQTIDIVPTVLSAAGLADGITSRMHGSDLMPSARGQKSLPSRPAFGAIYPNDAKILEAPSQHVRARWVRADRFKLITPGPGRPSIELALYDLQADPLEQHNLAGEPEYRNDLERLRGLLDKWWPAGNDSRVTKKPED